MYDVVELYVTESRESGCERASSYASIGEVTVGSDTSINGRALSDKLEEIEVKLAPMKMCIRDRATSGLAFPQTVGVKREYEDRCSHIGRLFLEILWTSQ